MIETMKTSVIGWAGLIRKNRDGSLYGSLWVVGASLGVLAVLMLSGCSSSSRANPVNPSLARESLKIAPSAMSRISSRLRRLSEALDVHRNYQRRRSSD